MQQTCDGDVFEFEKENFYFVSVFFFTLNSKTDKASSSSNKYSL